MAAFATRAPGAVRCGARPVRRVAGSIARRRRRGPEGLRAAGGAQARNVSGKARPVTGETCVAAGSASSSRGAYPGAVASLARRAPRALEDVEKVLTDTWTHNVCSGD